MKNHIITNLIKKLGPEVLPFERSNEPAKKPNPEEIIDFSSSAYDAIEDESPEPSSHYINIEEVKNPPEEKMFIWLIYLKEDILNFRLIPNNFENPEGIKMLGRKNVCHTNISAGGKALQGGECWWCEESKTMIVNYKSGRYGANTIIQFEAVIEFFKYVGYKNVITRI